ncbi:MAG: hypothetical protein ABJE47_25845 [bacterium]
MRTVRGYKLGGGGTTTWRWDRALGAMKPGEKTGKEVERTMINSGERSSQ